MLKAQFTAADEIQTITQLNILLFFFSIKTCVVGTQKNHPSKFFVAPKTHVLTDR